MPLAATRWLVERLRRAFVPVLACCLLLLSNAVPAAADRWYAPPPMLGIADAGREANAARQAGASWDRALFLWQEIQPNGPGDWTLDRYLDQATVRPTLSGNLPIVGIVQGTPGWAAVDWKQAAAAVPAGLDYPVDDPRNTFGQYMMRLAQAHKGRITTWMLWNEPDFLPGESGTWWTWSGTPSDFYKLLRTGYQAIKRVDPQATVVFPATTYFADAVNGRELFLARVLQEAEQDREAAANGYYFDAVGLNLYCSLDAVYRVYGIYSAILARFQLQKPIWLTETNCPVYNDASTPVSPAGRITTDEQAAYLIQSVALARAAGYQRIGWYSMTDHAPSSGIIDRWGLVRGDGSGRPAYQAFQVATRYLASPSVSARLAPFGTATADGWPVTRVVLDSPGERTRVHVLWRSAAGPPTVRVAVTGTAALTVDLQGRTRPAQRVDNTWDVSLPPARVPMPFDPPGFQSVGYPVLLVESGLPTGQVLDLPTVTSPQMALAPATLEVQRPNEANPRPPVASAPAAPPPPAALPPLTQPGPTLVLSVANPQPDSEVPRGAYAMQGVAFDRAATSGSGVDRVSVFLDDRDSGGQFLGDARLGEPNAAGFTVTVDFSRSSGKHTLFVYARSSVSGKETVTSFPITIR